MSNASAKLHVGGPTAFRGVRFVILIALVSAQATCMLPQHSSSIWLSPSTLNRNKDTYHGERVSVRGYVTIGFEVHTLYESKKLKRQFERAFDSDNFRPEDFESFCLTIANPTVFGEHSDRYWNARVEFEGTFDREYKKPGVIDLGACALPSAITVDPKSIRIMK
jgi:hypothetical protein